MATNFDLLDSIYPLPREELYRQWSLARDPSSLPAEWPHRTLRGWTLATHPEAHTCRLRGADGTPLGWVLEPLLQTTSVGTIRPSSVVTIPSRGAEISEAELEEALYGRDTDGHANGAGLEGMWIAVVLGESFRRVYLGPTHSVLYDPEQRMVATSQNLFPHWRRDTALSQAVDPLETNRFFSLGLTPFEGVRRLLPNHFLDLDTFEEARHWPRSPYRVRSGEEVATLMVEHGRRVVGELARDAPSIRVPLSAGNDSRAVLSLVKPFVDSGEHRVELGTAYGESFGKRVDLQGARRLARITGLPHEVRRRGKHAAAPVAAIMRNFARIGETRAGSKLSDTPLLGKAAQAEEHGPKPLTLGGMAGTVGRAFYWGDGIPGEVSPEDLLRRLEMPVLPRTIDAARAWLDGLPDFVRRAPADVLDLVYIEHRMGGWEAVSRYMYPGRPRVISPMACGFCIEAMLGLPVDYRLSKRLQRDIVALGWPELLDVPINRATGLLWAESKLRAAARRTRNAIGWQRGGWSLRTS